MKTKVLLATLIFVLCAIDGICAGRGIVFQSLMMNNVHVNGGFWRQRLDVATGSTLPYCLAKCEETGRIRNFSIAAGLEKGEHSGAVFDDSDVARVIEGVACSLAVKPDKGLETNADEIIKKIVAAQESDGYLYTYGKRGALENRWVGLDWGHELFNMGHMMEAAISYYQVTGKRVLLDAMIKSADLICKTFNETGLQQPDGHEEIEIALVRLYRVTGDAKYLNQAKFFTDCRGRKNRKSARGVASLYGAYAQDHIPVVEQDKAVGHAVRAAYLYCAMADIAANTGDKAYEKAVDKIWDNVVGKQMYISGGIGSSWGLGEAFGGDYDLPNLTAYCETCGSIANAMWNYRMFLLHGDGKYMDVFERATLNASLSGVSLDGKSFFYANPPGSMRGSTRSGWNNVACCVTNVCRFLPSIPSYAYAIDSSSIYVNLFMASDASLKIGPEPIGIKQETDYPWDGTVNMTVTPEKTTKFALRVRIPGWAQNRPVPSDLYKYMDSSKEPVSLKVNGQPIPISIENNYAVIDRSWQKGDKVELVLPMPVRKVIADPLCKWDAGRVAIERGPLVYCVEGVDIPNKGVFSLVVPDDASLKPEYKKDLLGGVVVLRGKALEAFRAADGNSIEQKDQEITLIPSYAYSNRRKSPMAIWLARNKAAAQPIPTPSIANKAKITSSRGRGSVGSLCDQIIPNGMGLDATPSLTWWPRNGALEWVMYEFAKEETISKAKVYWFDDRPGGVRIPESWRILYKDGNDWKPVVNQQPYAVDLDKMIEVNFDQVKSSAIKFEIQSIKTHSSGAYELTVE
ncbi:MAG: glycoside hydrolase family 127 protein [Armatimonadetes bacterium]|nr:glycoside hydrolase family 127 protein [Armatimonadota bacterium]